jgi:hypothetical protein
MIIYVLKYDDWYIKINGVFNNSYWTTPLLSHAHFFKSEKSAQDWLVTSDNRIDLEDVEIVKAEIKELPDDQA